MANPTFSFEYFEDLPLNDLDEFEREEVKDNGLNWAPIISTPFCLHIHHVALLHSHLLTDTENYLPEDPKILALLTDFDDDLCDKVKALSENGA